jgi:hypothetical protein
MVRPRVRFSSCSIVWLVDEDAPGAEGLFCFFLMRRNSSVSARTKFICCARVSSGLNVHQLPAAFHTYLVKGEQLASHLTAIMESNSHPVVDLTPVSHCWLSECTPIAT